MKKLFALLVVAGLVFVACNNAPEEETVAEEPMIEEQEAVVEDAQEQEAVDMPAEEATEETTEAVAE
ncbi:MAG: hypothetical protein J5701_07225 [Bacteroidales bacterium]|nr:hypothetical protein [Bacteroidales bacterium]